MISFVTVCHNSGELLTSYVESFLDHNIGLAHTGRVEFIFVENSGDLRTEGVASRLRDNGFAARSVMVENHGFGAGCNTGAELAHGRLLVFANPDILFLNEVTEIANRFTGTRWGTIRQELDDKLVYALDLLPEYRNVVTELIRPFRYLHKFPFLARFCYPVGSFLIVPRNSFFEVGGFNKRFFLYYEEAELSRRLTAEFGPPNYCNSVSILHKGFGTQSCSEFTLREEARGMLTYSEVTGQIGLPEARLRTLKFLSRISGGAARRIAPIESAIQEVRDRYGVR